MNKLKCFLFVTVATIALVGCRKPVEVSFADAVQEMEAQGGSVEVELKSNGEWTINSTEEWLSVSPMSGSGDATLRLTADANTERESRSAQITAVTKDNSATLTLTQKAPQYYLTVTPKTFQCGSEGGVFSVEVSSNVEWTVSLPQWITCSTTEGSNDMTVTLTVSPLEGDVLESREGDVIFGNPFGMVGDISAFDKVHVVQTLDPVLTIEVLPTNLVFACSGGTQPVNVITEDSWTVATEADWIVLSQTEGEGNAEVSVTIEENPIYFMREANVYFTTSAGLTTFVIVRQEASPDPHYLEVSPLELYFGKEGGEQDVAISCDVDWVVDNHADWLTTSLQTGIGNSIITFTASLNNVQETRETVVVVKSGSLSKQVIVSQEAGDEPLVALFEPDSVSAGYIGGFVNVNLISNTTWELESSEWITLLNSAGQGDASFDIVVDINQSPDGRTGFVNALHDGHLLGTITVVQEGKPNILEVTPTELEARPEGGEYIFEVSANQSWTVTDDVEWIQCEPQSGSNNGSFTIIVDALTSSRPREGHVKVSGSTGAEVFITVVQHP